MSKRITADERLDHLYMKGLRCPYCHTKIPKGTSTCPNCGITKEQIYHANLVTHRRKTKPTVVFSKVRPANIPFWKMGVGGAFGLLGVHCFVAKRYWRGALILACFLIFTVGAFLFTLEYENALGEMVYAPFYDIYNLFRKQTYMFPTELFGLVALVLWIWDWACILLGKFKYPVVISPEESQ